MGKGRLFMARSLFPLLFLELDVYVTHLKDLCRLVCFKHLIEWEMSWEEKLNLAFGGFFYQNRSKRS